ncbi:MAG TPA: DUF2071 domain-containing protein, partial [Vicinamibacterales bacterium]|nr:DUF2071 domain-containing protein [Vicinamibacterales bacterium]
AHRPWPLPDGTWIQAQTWDNLLFAHWRVDAGSLRTLVPEQIPIDTFDGSAWVGITPFRITGFRLRGTLPMPIVSSFPEINVRTYSTIDDKPGIWFFSLDTPNQLAVEAAKRVYRLPYFRSRATMQRRGLRIEYRNERAGAQFDATYEPEGSVTPPVRGTLEYFLTERYCLYTVYQGAAHRAEIHHPPWPLQTAEADIRENTMSPVALQGDPLLHYSLRQDVVIWPLERLA